MDKQMNPVGWFEIPVMDMERAKEFYSSVLGGTFEDHEVGPARMAWFVPMHQDAYGAAGTLIKGEMYEPSRQGVLVYFTAPDLVATLHRAADKGGKILLEKTPIGEHGYIGLVLDSEGNRIGLHSMQG